MPSTKTDGDGESRGSNIDVQDLDEGLNQGVSPQDVTVDGEPIVDNERTRSNDFRAEKRVYFVYSGGEVHLLRYSRYDHPEERGVSVVSRGDMDATPRDSVDSIERVVGRRDVADIIHEEVEHIGDDIVEAVLDWAHELELTKHGVEFDMYDDATKGILVNRVVEETDLDRPDAEYFVLDEFYGRHGFPYRFSFDIR